MKVKISRFIGVFLVASAATFYGCESTLNTGEETSSSGEQQLLFPSSAHIPTAANDGLLPLDISGITASNFVTAGTGTASKGVETINVAVPAGATIEQVYLYWSRRDSETSPAPSIIKVNGTEYTGSTVGGPVDTPDDQAAGITYRVNLTGKGIISAGPNSFTVQDAPAASSEPLGASVLVFYSWAGENSELLLFDGVDFLWADATAPNAAQQEALRTAEPVTFLFDAAEVQREARLTLFIGDVEPEDASERNNSLDITIGDNPTVRIGPVPSPFQAFQGAEWDNYTQDITIPAGVDKMTVEPISGPDDTRPASLVWSLAGLSVPIPAEGGQGCTPGYWRQPHHFDSWENYSPENILDDPFNVPSSLQLRRPERGAAESILLKEAIQLRGGGVNALIRHAVAALLSASNPDVSYNLTVSEVIDKFNDAVSGGNIEATKNEFEDFNEQGCPLN